MTILSSSVATFVPKSSRSSLRFRAISTGIVTVLSWAFVALSSTFLSAQYRYLGALDRTLPKPSLNPGWTNTNISSASQGKLWHPSVFRSFQGPRRTALQSTTRKRLSTPPTSPCSIWAVVTTIFEPTKLLHQLRNLSDTCLVIVGDHKTNEIAWRKFEREAPANRTVYLSVEYQQNLPFRSVKHIPWNHFGRKNIGYLYAISRGAEYIWDTDDDNILRSKRHFFALANLAKSTAQVSLAGISVATNTESHLWNPYPNFRPLSPRSASYVPDAWPRGLPLQFVRDNSSTDPALTDGSISVSDVGVFQSLANNDPDVDAIFRLTRELPLVFQKEHVTVALPHGRVSPFNAQATLWTREAFWGLLLPVTVHGRVSDIWRSYFTQRLMADVGLHTAFTSPVVKQVRNVHSLVADLQAEIPLYTQADELVRWLQYWKPKTDVGNSFLRMEQLIVDLYEIGIIEEQDVLLTQTWLDDLEAMGYGAVDSDQGVAERLQTKVDVSLPEAAEPVVESQPNVAVCVSGQLRTMTLKPEDEDHPKYWKSMTSNLPPPNMTVAESIQRVLYPRLGKPDVFMVVSTRETEHEPKVGDTSVCEPLRPRNGGHLSCQVLGERDVTIGRREMWEEFNRAKTVRLGDTLVQGLLQQLKGMWECHAAIQKHSKKTGKKYDWIVRMRPDNYMVEFPRLERLAMDAKVPTIWYGSFKSCCCGNEDRFGISRGDWMREYFERFMYLQTWDWKWGIYRKLGWNAEAFLKQVMKGAGVELLPHEDIHLCTVKPLHRKWRSDP